MVFGSGSSFVSILKRTISLSVEVLGRAILGGAYWHVSGVVSLPNIVVATPCRVV